MTDDFLKEFVACAGAALEAEDRFIREAGRGRGKAGGLLRSQHEKFYQYIVWKAAYSKWPTEVERSRHDLVILDPSDHLKYRCVFEMKNWLSKLSFRELPCIRSDVDTKLKDCFAEDSALIIFSGNDPGCMDQQLKFFEEQVFPGIDRPMRETYCFQTQSDEPNFPNGKRWSSG